MIFQTHFSIRRKQNSREAADPILPNFSRRTFWALFQLSKCKIRFFTKMPLCMYVNNLRYVWSDTGFGLSAPNYLKDGGISAFGRQDIDSRPKPANTPSFQCKMIFQSDFSIWRKQNSRSVADPILPNFSRRTFWALFQLSKCKIFPISHFSHFALN